jgi:hypothetical protein
LVSSLSSGKPPLPVAASPGVNVAVAASAKSLLGLGGSGNAIDDEDDEDDMFKMDEHLDEALDKFDKVRTALKADSTFPAFR